MNDTSSSNQGYNFLIRGTDYLKRHPDFKMVGRKDELDELASILLRKKANSIILTGPGGAGCSTLCMGLQASKENPDVTFDVIRKRFFWLDTDALFSSGSSVEINENFKSITAILASSWKDTSGYQPDTVLVIDDMKNFVDSARNFGCSNLINELMNDNKRNKFQIIAKVREDSLDIVLKCHSDMTEHFTLKRLSEPKKEDLRAIVEYNAQKLAEFHGIRISPEAIEQAIYLTNRYSTRDASLSRAQPERAGTLLDRAYASYRQRAHTHAPELERLEPELEDVLCALDDKASASLHGVGRTELEARKAVLEHEIKTANDAWATNQKKMKVIYGELRSGETFIVSKEDEITKLRQEDESKKKAQKGNDAVFSENPKIQEIRNKIADINEKLKKPREQYQLYAHEIDNQLELTKDHVLREFSELSGIPATKLTQNETEKLLKLGATLSARVFDQAQAISRVSDTIIAARGGVKLDPRKPDGAFLFLGPSGVGKTETALAVTQALYDDEANIIRIDMSEYMEENAVAKLIGAPPGYEGFEMGGALTNAVIKNPRSVVLFDEIEKGNKKIYNTLLQVLSAGRLTDNHGRVVDFSQTTIIMTSNIGSKYFLDPALTEEEAQKLAIQDLQKEYPPEFLNRFGGQRNIICYNKLPLSAIERITKRELAKVNELIEGKGVRLGMDDKAINDLVSAHYNPENGARGITGFFETDISSIIAKTLLRTPNAKGVMVATIDPKTKEMTILPPVIANQNQRPGIPSPTIAFNA